MMKSHKTHERDDIKPYKNNTEFLRDLDRVLKNDYNANLSPEELKEAGRGINFLLEGML